MHDVLWDTPERLALRATTGGLVVYSVHLESGGNPERQRFDSIHIIAFEAQAKSGARCEVPCCVQAVIQLIVRIRKIHPLVLVCWGGNRTGRSAGYRVAGYVPPLILRSVIIQVVISKESPQVHSRDRMNDVIGIQQRRIHACICLLARQHPGRIEINRSAVKITGTVRQQRFILSQPSESNCGRKAAVLWEGYAEGG